MVTKETLKIIIALLSSLTEKTNENARKIIFRYIKLSDIVPDNLIETVKTIVFRFMYDRNGLGYNGIINEVEKRIETIRYTEKILRLGGIPFVDFLLHPQGKTDTRDYDNRISYEEKSGCGDWLRNDNPSFYETIKKYERKTMKIRWDYSFTVETKKAGKEEYHVYIETSYKKLFAFLTDFNGRIETWFKENARSGKSGLYVWEMQTIKTSKKKADYLLTFDEWNRNH